MPPLDEAAAVDREHAACAMTPHKLLVAREEATQPARVVAVLPAESCPVLGAEVAALLRYRIQQPPLLSGIAAPLRLDGWLLRLDET